VRRLCWHSPGLVDVGTLFAEDTAGCTVGALCLPAETSRLGDARAYAHRAAAEFGLDADSCYELAFAVNEAVTNAIRHGTPDEHGQIHLSVASDGDRFTFAVRDYGTFVGSREHPAASVESGRGFILMSRLVDTVQLRVEPGSTTVLLSKVRLARQRER
jgi:stage II sporulation protein AB (anti-sigma F factor)